MNFDRLRHIAERTDIGENKELLLSVELSETPGALLNFCRLIGQRTITEFNYRFYSTNHAVVFVGIEINKDDPFLLDELINAGYKCHDLTYDECAKIHVRHMIGGIPLSPLDNEQCYRFQFPERPGALLEFLTSLNNQCNITMFHYRNHGAAYGRVLVGFDVNPKDHQQFKTFISQVPFRVFNESDNVAIATFLKE